MDPGAFPPDAEAVVASVGFQPRRRLEAQGGLERWRVVSHQDETGCAALVLPAAVASDELDRRIELLTTLRHPHLAATYRSLRTERGSRVVLGAEVDGLALELIRGIRPRWEPGEVVTLVTPLAGALAYLHRHGIVHGALAVDSVTIALDGRPMLEGLVRGTSPAAPSASQDDDVRALAMLGLSLLDAAPSVVRDVLAAAAEPQPPGEADDARLIIGDAAALAHGCEIACQALPIRLPSAEMLAARAISVQAGGHEAAQVGRRRLRPLPGRAPARHRRGPARLLIGFAIGCGVVAALALGLPAVRSALARAPGAIAAPTATAIAAAADGATDPVGAARELTRLRDEAIEAMDERALTLVTVDGSAARQQDLAFLHRLGGAGMRLDGLGTEIIEAIQLDVPGSVANEAVTARVLLSSRVGAHREVGPGGQVLREVPSTAVSQVVLALTWTPEGWRVSEVKRATP